MPTPRLRRALAVALAVTALAGGAVALAVAERVVEPATADTGAERVPQPIGDLVSVYDAGDIDPAVVSMAAGAARRAGAVATPMRTGSLGLVRVTRGERVVHAPPAGYMIPMVYSAIPHAVVGRIVGPHVSAMLGPNRVVLNEMTAGIMGAAKGDRIEIRASDGSVRSLAVAGVLPYAEIGGADMIITTEVAARLGATADTRVVIWGFSDRAAIDRALAQLDARPRTRVLRSWSRPDPDSTLGTPRVKQALGEPWYGFAADGQVVMHPDWVRRNLTDGRVLLDPTIRIEARCHVEVVGALRAALADVATAGLGGAIDVDNANTYGGCYAPRFNRLSGQIGFLSRHSYGMALDTNTASNCQGCTPQMDCDVVRIFRRHGFAWGGNFLVPDGMHFEWVGERRDLIEYPSTYCPNVVSADTRSAAAPTWGNEVLVAGTEH